MYLLYYLSILSLICWSTTSYHVDIKRDYKAPEQMWCSSGVVQLQGQYVSRLRSCWQALGVPGNRQCLCQDGHLHCPNIAGATTAELALTAACNNRCWCAGEEGPLEEDDELGDDSLEAQFMNSGYNDDVTQGDPANQDPSVGSSSGALTLATGSGQGVTTTASQETVCGVKCSSLSDCSGSCVCTGLAIVWIFWWSGNCKHKATAFHDGLRKRSIARSDSVFANSSTSIKSSTPTNSSNEVLIPVACNSTYVSYACASVRDGLVWESPENWLGG